VIQLYCIINARLFYHVTLRLSIKEIKMKKTALYNPHAGKDTVEEKIAFIKSVCTEDTELTDITNIESYADFFSGLDPETAVVICGGDGTLNRFVNETRGVDYKNEITYLPLGTGNDFLKDIGSDAACGEISVGKYIKDLPSVTLDGKDYLFLNNVGFGIDGYCCEVGDSLKEKGKTKINYTGIAIKGLLFNFKPKNATVTVDGIRHEYKKVWIAPTMNGRYYGGGMMPTPDQDRLNDDGELSVMIWHGSGKLKTLMAFPSLFKGEHLKYTDMIDILKGHEITVEFDSPCALQIDGETHLGVTKYCARSRKTAAATATPKES